MQHPQQQGGLSNREGLSHTTHVMLHNATLETVKPVPEAITDQDRQLFTGVTKGFLTVGVLFPTLDYCDTTEPAVEITEERLICQ